MSFGVGKTTLAREIAAVFGGAAARFDLEDMDVLARLSEPKLALERLRGLVVIDEIQLRADLFPLLRVLGRRLSSAPVGAVARKSVCKLKGSDFVNLIFAEPNYKSLTPLPYIPPRCYVIICT